MTTTSVVFLSVKNVQFQEIFKLPKTANLSKGKVFFLNCFPTNNLL